MATDPNAITSSDANQSGIEGRLAELGQEITQASERRSRKWDLGGEQVILCHTGRVLRS